MIIARIQAYQQREQGSCIAVQWLRSIQRAVLVVSRHGSLLREPCKWCNCNAYEMGRFGRSRSSLSRAPPPPAAGIMVEQWPGPWLRGRQSWMQPWAGALIIRPCPPDRSSSLTGWVCESTLFSPGLINFHVCFFCYLPTHLAPLSQHP